MLSIKNKKYYLGLVLFLTISSKTLAQAVTTYPHTTFWSRLAFQKTIKKLELRLELDYRQQNDFQKNNSPFAKPLLRWIRLQTAYTTGSFTHTIILPNPIKTYPLYSTSADLSRHASTEWRYTFFEEYSHKYNKWSTALRTGLEYRSINTNNVHLNTGRIRFRIAQSYIINPKNNLNLAYENLYNTAPNKATNTFSQSQLSLRYNHNFGEKISITTGFNHLNRKRPSLVEYDMENAILCNLLYKL
jgi:hypothetical protein